MGSPTRKRRAWTTFDDDVDAQESAALEASLAAAKDRAAESGALLSSAKEDLSDHQRWLQAQSAAVRRDRERHERWLQRQRDLRAASVKKDRLRRHRRVMRQRALQALRQAFLDLFGFFWSWVAFGLGKVAGGVGFIARSIAMGATYVWRAIVRALSSAFRGAGQFLGAVGGASAQGALWTASKIGAAGRAAGKGVAAGAAWSGGKAKASARAGGQALSAGSLAVASEAANFSRKAGSALGSGLSTTGHSAAALAATTGHGLSSGASAAAQRASALGASGGRGLSHAFAWTASRAAAIPSKLYIHVARLGHEVQHFARVRAAAPRSLPEGSQSHNVPRADVDGAAHTASVHVFETYGPHPEGTMLFGQPANDPWTASALRTAGAVDDRGVRRLSDDDVAGAQGRTDAQAVLSAAVSGVAVGTATVVSSWARDVRGRADCLAARARRNATTGSVWLRGQAARAVAFVQTGVDALGDRVASRQDSVVARGADWARKKGSTSVT